MSTTAVVILIIVIAALAAVAWLYFQKERSRKLKSKFGPEYERLVEEQHGDRRRAEAELERREKRVEKLHIRELNAEETERFSNSWRVEQARFVDDPRAAVAAADSLVRDAMRARGYPMGEFDNRIADISVNHPRVVEHYRAAHDIALRDERNQASTEDLRVAMQHYRQLFEDLLDQRVNRMEEVRR